MVKHFSLRQIKKRKTRYFHKKLQKSRVRRGRPGRPPKCPIKSHRLTFAELLSKPSKIQTFEEFSEIPKKMLSYFSEGHPQEKFELWISKKASLKRPPEPPKIDKLYEKSPLKQRFFEFMFIVYQRTRDSLGLNKLPGDILKTMVENFVEYSDSFGKHGREPAEELVRQKMMRLFMDTDGNEFVGSKIRVLFNERLFRGVLDAFNRWKRLFDEQFAEE